VTSSLFIFLAETFEGRLARNAMPAIHSSSQQRNRKESAEVLAVHCERPSVLLLKLALQITPITTISFLAESN